MVAVNSSMASVFIAGKPEFHCTIPEPLHQFNCSIEVKELYAIPDALDDDKGYCSVLAWSMHSQNKQLNSQGVTPNKRRR